MFQNNNSAVPKRLAQRSLHTDRRRNLITVIAIALTTLLFTSVLTMGSGSVESIQRATMAMVGGDGHASVKYVTDEEFKKIKRNPLVKEMAYCRMLCDSVDNSSLIKRHTEFWYYDNTGLKFGFAEPTGGHRPSAENEVIADTKTLELMGIPLKVGSPIKLELTVHGKQVQRDFVLAGWWKSDPGFNVGQIFASVPMLMHISVNCRTPIIRTHPLPEPLPAISNSKTVCILKTTCRHCLRKVATPWTVMRQTILQPE